MSQTIANVPTDLTDTTSVKRFMLELTENLDVVLGYKGSTKYVTNKELSEQQTSLTELIALVKSNVAKLKILGETHKDLQESTEELEDLISTLEDYYTYKSLDVTFRDFNSSSWFDLDGRGEFMARGAVLVNAPFTPNPNSVYTIYVESSKAVSSTIHNVTVVTDNRVDKYVRAKNTWIHLAKV